MFKRSLATIAVAALVLTGCGNSDSADDTDAPLQVLYVSGITGLLSPSATGVERGIKAAIDDLNENGGVRGRQVALVTKDNQSDPTRGVTLVQESLNSDTKPDVVIPGVSTNEALAVAPLLDRNGILGVGASSSAQLNDPAKFPYYFSVSALQEDVLAAVADFVAKDGAKKVAVVSPDDGLGDAVGDVLQTEFESVGVTSTDSRFKSDAVDYSGAFAKALESDPDWIFVEGAGAQVGHILSSRLKAGAEKVPTIAGVTMGSQPLLDLTKGTKQMENLNLVLQPAQVFRDEDERSDEFTSFISRIKEQGGIDVSLSTYAAGWEAIKIWAAGMENVDGDLTIENVRKAFESLPSPDKDRIQYTNMFTPDNHYVDAQPDEFTIAEPVELVDGMFVVK